MYNCSSIHTCDISVQPALSSVAETIHVESLSQYEPLTITTGDVSSHYLNSYDILHEVDGQMKVFSLNSSELLLSGYEPLNITSEDNRSHHLNIYELLNNAQKGEFQLKEFQQIIIPELTSEIPHTKDTKESRSNDDDLFSESNELLNNNPTEVERMCDPHSSLNITSATPVSKTSTLRTAVYLDLIDETLSNEPSVIWTNQV